LNTLRCPYGIAKERQMLGCGPSGFACQVLDQVRLLRITHATIPLANLTCVTT